jgi:WD40 repeat protein
MYLCFCTYADACTQAATSRHGTLKGHKYWVWCVAISGDGTCIVSGSLDGTVKVWDRNKSVCTSTLRTDTMYTANVADIRGDGNLLASCRKGGRIKLWDIAHGKTPKELRTLKGHTGMVWSVRFSPDGTKIVSSSDDKTMRIWSVQTGKVLQTLECPKGWALCVAWSSDSRLVASAGSSGCKTVRVWDVVGGTQATQPLRGHSGNVLCVVWGRRDASLLVSSSEDKTIIVWHLEGESATVMHTLRGHTDRVMSVSLSSDDAYIVSGSNDKTVRVWEVATWQQVKVLKGHRGLVTSVAWSRDGECIVSGSEDKTVRVWEVDDQVRVCVCLHLPASSRLCMHVWLGNMCVLETGATRHRRVCTCLKRCVFRQANLQMYMSYVFDLYICVCILCVCVFVAVYVTVVFCIHMHICFYAYAFMHCVL